RALSDYHSPPGSMVISYCCFHLNLLSCELDTSFIASHSNVSARSNANEIVSPSNPSGLSDMVDLRIIFPLLFMTKACGLAKGMATARWTKSPRTCSFVLGATFPPVLCVRCHLCLGETSSSRLGRPYS